MLAKKNKEEIRAEMKVLRKKLSAKFAKDASFAICRNLREFLSDKDTSQICAFYPSFGEPDILPFLREIQDSGGVIYLPCWTENEGYKMRRIANFADALKPGRFSIPEPVSGDFASKNSMPEIWLVPGLAFSKNGARLGYGQGNYDKLLFLCDGIKIGICYDFQITTEFHSENHDIEMDFVSTEKNIYKCK